VDRDTILRQGQTSVAIENNHLILEARAGDQAAFGQLVAHYEVRVQRTARRILGDADEARDAAQEVFLRFYRSLKRFDQRRDPLPWLYRITVNVCRSLLRQRRRQPLARASELGGEGSAGMPATAPAQENGLVARALLEQALERLTPREREVVVLRDLEGRSLAEVARAARCLQGTVRSHLSRGRLKIIRYLEEQRGGDR
jgi:RNA polymerase sigma-70 factor (ECF subfamily)